MTILPILPVAIFDECGISLLMIRSLARSLCSSRAVEPNVVISGTCSGCGAEFQTSTPSKPGFLNVERVSPSNHILCQRCYRIRNNGISDYDDLEHRVKEDDVSASLALLKREKCAIMHLVNVCVFL